MKRPGPVEYHREAVLALILESEKRLTARACIREISRHLDIPAKSAKAVLRELVERRDLAFQDLYGNTCITENFDKPVQVSPNLCLAPPGRGSICRHTIILHPGISFGSGHHPTTRLSLQAIDHLYFTSGLSSPGPGETGADIGTGSGVLAIALCTCGLGRALAFDIDPNAVHEAGRNVEANNLSGRIPVADSYFPPGSRDLSIICANLRVPTLKTLAPLIRDRLIPGGWLILSGIREWETADLISRYKPFGFKPLWHQQEKNWAAIILHNRDTLW